MNIYTPAFSAATRYHQEESAGLSLEGHGWAAVWDKEEETR